MSGFLFLILKLNTMRVNHIKIENFKNIDFAEINMQGCNVILSGENSVGKTSIIDAIVGRIPALALKEGRRKGKIVTQIDGGYTVERILSEKHPKGKLKIYDGDGQILKSPAKLFEKLFGIQSFKIDEFLSKTDKQQVEHVKGLLGLDWSIMDADYDKHFENRAFEKRKAKELDAKVEGVFHDPKLKVIELEPLQEAGSLIIKHNELVTKAENTHKERTESLNKAIKEKKDAEQRIIEINAFIKLKNEEITKVEGWQAKNKVKSIDEANAKVNEAIVNNEKVIANDANKVTRNEAVASHKKIEDLDEKLEEILNMKKDELAGKEFPVKGMTFENDSLYLDGLPFNSDQINSARRLMAGVELAYHSKGELDIATFDASLMDNKSIDYIKKWADEKGIQLFMEMMDRDQEKLVVEIEECTGSIDDQEMKDASA